MTKLFLDEVRPTPFGFARVYDEDAFIDVIITFE